MESDANKLSEYMSELSEQAYCAGWMQGLEYALWNAVLKGRVKYGRLQITRAHTQKLKELSEQCGGWIVWDDDLGEAFMPLDQWQKKYEAEHRSYI
jgi:hypothetical protein